MVIASTARPRNLPEGFASVTWPWQTAPRGRSTTPLWVTAESKCAVKRDPERLCLVSSESASRTANWVPLGRTTSFRRGDGLVSAGRVEGRKARAEATVCRRTFPSIFFIAGIKRHVGYHTKPNRYEDAR